MEIDSLKNELEMEKEAKDDLLREKWEKEELTKWRSKDWIVVGVTFVILVTSLLWAFSASEWQFETLVSNLVQIQLNVLIVTAISIVSTIFWAIYGVGLINKYRNHPNIQAYLERRHRETNK